MFRASLVVEETNGEVERERGVKLVDDVFVAFSALSLCPCTACTCARILPSAALPRSSGMAPCFQQHLQAALGCYVCSKLKATKPSRDSTT